MRGLIQRGVAMHDQKSMIARIIKESGADPDQIGFPLLRHRDAGPYAGMDKDTVAAVQPRGPRLQEIAMRLRYGLHRLGKRA